MNSRNFVLYAALILIGVLGGYFAFKAEHAYQHAKAKQATATTTATSTAKQFTLVVQRGTLISGSGDITVNEGDTVSLTVTNDADNELHLHGYNLMTDLKAGQPGTITFQASASGRFPFELEQTKQDIGAISVLPQ